MKKKIIVGTIASIALSTLLMAHAGDSDNDSMIMGQEIQQGKASSGVMVKKGQTNQGMMLQRGKKRNMGMRSVTQGHMQMMKNMRKMHKKMMMNMLSKLNLSDTQKKEIAKLQKKYMTNPDKILEAFGKNSFDKEKFIKIMQSKRENMIKSRANILDGIFKILDKKQREDFVTLIRAKHIMMR